MGRVRTPDEWGSAVLELLLVVLPAIAAVADLIVYTNRVPTVRAEVDKAAKAAAQEASVHRSPSTAQAAARAIAADNLELNHVPCDDVTVTLDTSDWRAGGLVRADISCSVSTSDLQWLPFPGRQVVASSFVAPIDSHKDLSAANT
jgi:hypothetical protein